MNEEDITRDFNALVLQDPVAHAAWQVAEIYHFPQDIALKYVAVAVARQRDVLVRHNLERVIRSVAPLLAEKPL